MKRYRWVLLVPLFLFTMGASDEGCDSQANKAVRVEQAAVGQQDLLYQRAQPPPAFDWSLERHLLTELYRARNNAVATYTFVRSNFTGKVMFSCPSIGFPIPANTQLTNPEKIAESAHQYGYAILPQSEPNGLYTSPSTTGTFVMCTNERGNVVPAYFEADVETYLQPMRVDGNGEIAPVQGGKPSLEINPKRP